MSKVKYCIGISVLFLFISAVSAKAFVKPAYFEFAGSRIAYYDTGVGPPLVLVHGFGASALTWRKVVPPLAKKYRVIMLDLKGYGYSDKPKDGRYSLDEQSRIVAALINRLKLENVILAGHSMGGGVALYTYFRVPEKITRIVLIDSAGFPQKFPFFVKYLRIPIVSAVLMSLIPDYSMAKMVLDLCIFDKSKITKEMISVYSRFLSLPGAKYALRKTAEQIMPPNIDDVIADYSKVNVPVLIIWGGEDRVIPKENAYKFKRVLPDSELYILPECGHIPQEEQPAQLLHFFGT